VTNRAYVSLSFDRSRRGLNVLKESCSAFSLNDLSNSQDFQTACEDLFAQYGPRLWEVQVYRTAWLVGATINDWGGLYPRNLTYSDIVDQDLFVCPFPMLQNLPTLRRLRSNFVDLLHAKCVRYHDNKIYHNQRRMERDNETPMQDDWEASSNDEGRATLISVRFGSEEMDGSSSAPPAAGISKRANDVQRPGGWNIVNFPGPAWPERHFRW
jgi:hypothetical protein